MRASRRRLLALGVALGALAAPLRAADAPQSRVTYDHYSILIDGKRTMLWSAEFHPFRLPSPSLWRDVLQKMKPSGFSTGSVYFG